MNKNEARSVRRRSGLRFCLLCLQKEPLYKMLSDGGGTGKIIMQKYILEKSGINLLTK